MTVKRTHDEQGFHLAILGDVNRRGTLKALSEELTRLAQEPLTLSFYDARTLPAAILAALVQRYQQGIKTRLMIYHEMLASYLFRLQIPHTLQTRRPEKSANTPCKALVLGGSAGSFHSILEILQQLPESNISIFVVQHILADHPNQMAQLLQGKTRYQVKEAEQGAPVEPGHVYIAPPGCHTRVQKGHIELGHDPPQYFARPSIDVLFESLAIEYGTGLIAILLSGYNNDGSHSLANLQRCGSTVIIQDPQECREKELLLHGRNTGHFDYIFPLTEMHSYLSRRIGPPQIIPDRELAQFLQAIYETYGYDYRQYSPGSLQRLLRKEMHEQGIYRFSHFREHILSNPEAFERLFLEFSVNVTHFFRKPSVFEKIRTEIIPYLRSYPHIKIWSAACSTGEEPYSLAILLAEEGLLHKSHIYATDINPYMVEIARNGYFSKQDFEDNQSTYQQSGGKGQFSDWFEDLGLCLRIRPELLKPMLFFSHSLVNTGILNEFNLILCRNVLIYFQPELQQHVMTLLYNSCVPNGFVVLGETEMPASLQGFSVYDSATKILKSVHAP
jgi:chemotaxis protein methyltransferase CheR